MSKFSWIAFACAVSMGAIAADTEVGAPASSGAVQVTTRPIVVSRPQLVSPDGSREGVVYVRLVVSSDGRPIEIEVQEDLGFHTPLFTQTAIEYVRRMKFKPATRDGVPVAFGPLTQRLNFSLGLRKEDEGVTPEFRRELNKVAKFIKDGDYAGAQFHAEWMLREKVKLSYEFAVLQAQLAQTLANTGRYDEALKAAQLASSSSSSETTRFKIGEPPPKNDASRYLLPRDVIVHVLDLRMRLLAQRGEVLSALKTYNELAGLEKLKAGDPRTAIADKLVGLLQSGNALVFSGEVTKEFWSHQLFHPRFTTRNVQGKLGIVHLHCGSHYAEYAYEAERLWTVPHDWEGCVVEFYGEPGAKLELMEMPGA
jgi:TonB family protein